MPGKSKREEPEKPKPEVPKPGRESPGHEWIRRIEPMDVPSDDTGSDTPTEDSGDEITPDHRDQDAWR